MKQPSLFDSPAGDAPPATPDQAARDFAVDPANDVVLEASAGTGKTRVLVDRYVRLIEAGVDPRHILAMTFTRKAAAEMRDRVLALLRRRAVEGGLDPARWRDLRDRAGDIQISTIDAFCFGLLREFPLEAGVDPGFDIADETEMARFANEALDLTLRAARGLVIDDETVRLLFTRVKLPVLRDAIASLLDRRQVALPAVAHFVARQASAPTRRRRRSAVRQPASRSARRLIPPARAAERRAGTVRPSSTGFASISRRWPISRPCSPTRMFSRKRRRECNSFAVAWNGISSPRTASREKSIVGEFGPSQFASADARRRHEQSVQALAPRNPGRVRPSRRGYQRAARARAAAAPHDRRRHATSGCSRSTRCSTSPECWRVRLRSWRGRKSSRGVD